FFKVVRKSGLVTVKEQVRYLATFILDFFSTSVEMTKDVYF
ncbi:MAG: hypothetical protein ACJAVF_004811, partial [Paraglaciecola sp.]